MLYYILFYLWLMAVCLGSLASPHIAAGTLLAPMVHAAANVSFIAFCCEIILYACSFYLSFLFGILILFIYIDTFYAYWVFIHSSIT